MLNANNLQNSAQIANVQNYANTTPDHLHNAIRIQTKTIHIDAIVKVEHAIQHGPDSTTRTLMDLTKAFDCVNRQLLWTTLYKTGIPVATIKHIKQGHQNTKLRCKDNGKYGNAVINNVGVFQGSSLSALLFIIYLEDMMQHYQSMNDKQQLPQRSTIQINPQAHNKRLCEIIQKQQNNQMNKQK